MKYGEAPPGFRLAPSFHPALVLRVLDLDIPTLVEALFQQDALTKHLIRFIGRPLGTGEPKGGGDKQKCKEKAHDDLYRSNDDATE